jgi:hypothetical protein
MTGAELVLNDTGNGSAITFASNKLQLIVQGGATVVVTDKINTGEVYDTYFNPVPVSGAGTVLLSWTTSLTSATQTLGTGVSVPSDGWYAMAIDVDVTGATITQGEDNGYKVGLRYDNAGYQATVVPSSSQVMDASELLPIGGWNEFKFSGYTYLTRNATLGTSVVALYNFSGYANNVSGGTVNVNLIRVSP